MTAPDVTPLAKIFVCAWLRVSYDDALVRDKVKRIYLHAMRVFMEMAS